MVCSPGIAKIPSFGVGVSLVEPRIVGIFVPIPQHEIIHFLKSLLRNYYPAFSGIHEAAGVMKSVKFTRGGFTLLMQGIAGE